MNRAALDEFFANAEDVLTDWHPSGDAMVARVPDTDSDDLAPVGDSYYDQTRHSPGAGNVGWVDLTLWLDVSRWAGSVSLAEESLLFFGRRLLPTFEGFVLNEFTEAKPATEVRERALQQRRERNTGPRSRVGLDGHFRR